MDESILPRKLLTNTCGVLTEDTVEVGRGNVGLRSYGLLRFRRSLCDAGLLCHLCGGYGRIVGALGLSLGLCAGRKHRQKRNG